MQPHQRNAIFQSSLAVIEEWPELLLTDEQEQSDDQEEALIPTQRVGSIQATTDSSEALIVHLPAVTIDFYTRFIAREWLSLQRLVYYLALGHARSPIDMQLAVESPKPYSLWPNTPRTIRLYDPRYLKRAASLNSFWHGMQCATQVMWPLACLSMLGYDTYQYFRYPKERFLNQQGYTILLGRSPNYGIHHEALLTHLGSDLAVEPMFWLGFGLLVGSPVVLGLLNRLRRIDACEGTPFFGRDASFGLLWQGDLSPALRQQHLDYFVTWAYEGSIINRLQAIGVLAEVADSFRGDALGENALHQLQRLASLASLTCHPSSWLGWWYAHYQQWSIGRSSTGYHRSFFYLTHLPLSLLIHYHGWRLILTKLITAGQYGYQWYQCHRAHKHYRVVDVLGDYACTVCDDVDYRSSQQGQSCLDQTLARPEAITTLAAKLSQWLDHGPFEHLDLSRQPWWQWSPTHWSSLQLALADYPPTAFARMNFSASPALAPPLITAQSLNAMATLLTHRSVHTLDWQGIPLGAKGMQRLLPTLQTLSLLHLNLSRTALGDQGVARVSQLLLTTPLVTLDLSYNAITDLGMLPLLVALPRATSLSTLVIDGNALSALTWQRLATVMANTTLQRLSVAGMNFRKTNMTQWGLGLASAPQLTDVVMANCQLDDTQIIWLAPYLMQSTVTALDWSANALTPNSASALALLLTHRLAQLQVDNNRLSDHSLPIITSALSQSPLVHLSLNNNLLTAQGFQAVIPALLQAPRLVSLALADNELGPALQALLAALRTQRSKLAHLYFDRNSLTSDAARLALPLLANSSLLTLSLNGQLLNEAMASLAAVLPNTALTSLAISEGELTTAGIRPLIASLAHSRLTQLDLSGNALDDAGGLALANQLITTALQPLATQQRVLRLGDRLLPVDNRRAIARAIASTLLQTLRLNNNQLGTRAVRALCQVMPSTTLTIDSLVVANNPYDATAIAVVGCPASSMPQLAPSMMPADQGHALSSSARHLQPPWWLTSPTALIPYLPPAYQGLSVEALPLLTTTGLAASLTLLHHMIAATLQSMEAPPWLQQAIRWGWQLLLLYATPLTLPQWVALLVSFATLMCLQGMALPRVGAQLGAVTHGTLVAHALSGSPYSFWTVVGQPAAVIAGQATGDYLASCMIGSAQSASKEDALRDPLETITPDSTLTAEPITPYYH